MVGRRHERLDRRDGGAVHALQVVARASQGVTLLLRCQRRRTDALVDLGFQAEVHGTPLMSIGTFILISMCTSSLRRTIVHTLSLQQRHDILMKLFALMKENADDLSRLIVSLLAYQLR